MDKRDILYDDIYEDIKVFARVFPKSDFYKKTYPRKMGKELKVYRRIIKTIINYVENKRNIFDKSMDSILVFPFDRFAYLCTLIGDQYNILTFSNVLNNSFREMKTPNTKSLYYIDVLYYIYQGFKRHDIHYGIKAVNIMKGILLNNKIKAIIMGDDETFIERTIALAGKELGIPVIVFQHGIYEETSIRTVQTGRYSTQFWCWSEYVKDIYEDAYHPNEGFVQVVGYPHKVMDTPITNTNRVLLIGDDWEKQGGQMYDGFEHFVEEVCCICNELELEFSLRLHPGETIDFYNRKFGNLEGFNISKEKDLMKDISNSGILIGGVSSALLEGGLAHRKTIMVIWNDLIRAVSDNRLYDSMIRVNNDHTSVKRAISDNIGDYDDSNVIAYNVGKYEGVRERILKLLSGICSSKQ